MLDIKKSLVNGLVIIINYVFIMSIVELTCRFTNYTPQSAFVGIGLIITLMIAIKYCRR